MGTHAFCRWSNYPRATQTPNKSTSHSQPRPPNSPQCYDFTEVIRSTPSRAEINLANSQHSTGPNSAAGKRRSSQNALRHGLTAQSAVLPTDDPAAYQVHLEAFTIESDLSWRLKRVGAIETSGLRTATDSPVRTPREFANIKTLPPDDGFHPISAQYELGSVAKE